MGDLHQPLHLTGRARGGNDIAVHYQGRYARLHTVWDSQILDTQIRELDNYTVPLRSARIESALMGKPYDAYIRWILAEGLGQGVSVPTGNTWWHDEMEEWTQCPETSKGKRAHWLRTIAPYAAKVSGRVYGTIFQKARPSALRTDPTTVDDTDLPICPYAWSKPMHPLVCKYAFAKPVPEPEQDHHVPLVEVDVDEYTGRLYRDRVLQKQLAQAGVRLAAVLNSLLLPDQHGGDSLAEDSMFAPSMDLGIFSRIDEKRKTFKHGGHHNGQTSRSPIIGLILVTAESIAEVVILSSVGYYLARQGVLDKATQTKINKLNVSFFTPALLFSKVAFTLDPARLAELIIVPAGFVIITLVSALAAYFLSSIARLSKAQRNFSIACAITPNSNSLPVALMQSLVVTVPQLHWEEDGEPEDNVNGMLGRALTYLVLFSTLGMFLRWSLASRLLSTIDDVEATEAQADERVPTGRLVDAEDLGDGHQAPSASTNSSGVHINVRRPTEEGGSVERVASPRGKHGPPAWVRSFPNSPASSEDESDVEDQDAQSSLHQQPPTLAQALHGFFVPPLKAVAAFMTMPLYSAVISLVVAMIPPLQKAVSSIEPLVGALETAGACSIPLTMVVLGAYFYQESDAPPQKHDRGPGSGGSTLVNPVHKSRKPIPFRNGEQGLNGQQSQSMESPLDRQDTDPSESQKKSKQRSMERRTVAVAVGSRMLLTPIILLPCATWYAIATRCESYSFFLSHNLIVL